MGSWLGRGVDQRIRVGEGKSEEEAGRRKEGEDPSHLGEMEGHRNETGKREQLYRLATSVPLTFSTAVPNRSCVLRDAGMRLPAWVAGCMIYEGFFSTAPHPAKKVRSPGIRYSRRTVQTPLPGGC